jgi:hypothetical protein
VVDEGHAGAAGQGEANRFRLTYVNDKHRVQPSHEWRRITTLEDAEKIAEEARSKKNPRAQMLGERSARAARQRKNSVMVSGKTDHGNHDSSPQKPITETVTTMGYHGNRDHYLESRLGGGGSADG